MHRPHIITSFDRLTRATIVPSLGFNCIEFLVERNGQTYSFLDADPEFLSGKSRPARSGIPILFPFPNRIRDGKMNYRRQVYEISPSAWSTQTIHGFCVNRAWQILESTPHSITGEFLLSRDAPELRTQWPADARLILKYSVETARLRADITIENPDTVPLPWGFGTHPYFRLPLGTGHAPEECVVRAAASEQWELDQCFPTGKRIPIPANKDLTHGWQYGSCPLDDVYTALSPRHRTIVQMIEDPVSQLRLTQRSCDDFRELVVFTPQDRPVICLEPYTCTTDAGNLQASGLDAGWRELAPGEKASLWFDIEVSAMPS